MVATANVNKFNANNLVTMYDHDPANSTVATDVAWVDMRDFEGIVINVFASTLSGNGITVFQIIGNSQSNGGGSDSASIISHAVGSPPVAVGDWLTLECSAEMIRELETGLTGELRYVTALLTANNSADEAVVVYTRYGAKFPRDGLTADVVA